MTVVVVLLYFAGLAGIFGLASFIVQWFEAERGTDLLDFQDGES